MAPDLRRIVLIGFSGTGKSAVAQGLAARLNRRALDTDALIEEAAGRPITEIFAREGEAAFRSRERDAVQRAAAERNAVVATGGGAFMDAGSRRLLAADGLVVALEARVDTIAERTGATGAPDVRPLLAAPDSLARIRNLKAARQPFYALADLTVRTDTLDVDAVVDEIITALNRHDPRALHSQSRLDAIAAGPGLPSTAPPDFGGHVACTVRARDGFYPVFVGWGLLERLPEKLDAVGLSGDKGARLFLVADASVLDTLGEPVLATLRSAGREVRVLAVPPGEASKSLDQLARIYDWLARERAERGDAVLALGGGVVGDLAGTAAATYLRGMALVHLPTTLLAMVDASIGGKVAIDLPAGKNLVGAFHPPRAVVADVATLASLPDRDRRAGFAEVIKHAWIRDPAMLDDLERDAASLLALGDDGADRDRLVDLVARNAESKAAIVSADEREAELRLVLNYGHTIAHALEAATGYQRLLHGEAVGVGLLGAAMIAGRLGLLDSANVNRHRTLLNRFGLPSSVSGVDPDAVERAIFSDKKVRGGVVQWVLLEEPGRPVIRADVPAELMREVLADLTADADRP